MELVDATLVSHMIHHPDSVFLLAATSVATPVRMRMQTDVPLARPTLHFNLVELVSVIPDSQWMQEDFVLFKAATTPVFLVQLG
jgi:hypothetical protein